ncbi:ABC transporter substrate-binding protein [Paenibacillus eucommiae]|uniref:Multiple sugar transport system substrate-binding protein n=1 Tax=Paenibacillus eucommiae TaxID=1355755 RepID=A0ABS4IV50_9BACL|nr:extracellular solute-binding protein [Paenibacillus eucommiae]MBP1990871.1 multiple sugar transport system substrate-binding protein [Paenibacillus eucommiae]
MNKWLRSTIGLVLVMLIVVTAAGCREEEGKVFKAVGENEKAMIKVLCQDESEFYSQYGSLFLAEYPNIEVQVISTAGNPSQDIDAIIEAEKPDVLILDTSQYEKYANGGYLYDLDAAIRQGQFDLAGILPAVTDSIKDMSGGKLYGLAPRFSSQALYYNKDSFDRYSVPYPKDKMSWEEVLELAQRFPREDDAGERTYGFMFNRYDANPYNSALTIGFGKGLSYFDLDTMQMTIDTEEWKKVFQLAFDVIQSGAVYEPPEQNGFIPGMGQKEEMEQDPFFGGKTAMMISANDFMAQLKRAKSYLKDRMPEWDIVSVPVDQQNPDVGNVLWIRDIFTIHAQSANVEAAWAFVSYINSDTFARVTAKAQINGTMPARAAFLKDDEGHNLEAFTALKPNPNIQKGSGEVPQSFFLAFGAMAEQETKLAYKGEQSLETALANIQQKGQALLQAEMNSQ